MGIRKGRLVLAVLAVAALQSQIPAKAWAQNQDPGGGGGSCQQVAPETGATVGAAKGGTPMELRFWIWLSQRMESKAGPSRIAWISQYSRPVVAPVARRTSQR